MFRDPYRCFGCGSRFIGSADKEHFRPRKKSRSLATFIGLRSAEQKRLARLVAVVIFGVILSVLIMLIVRQLTESVGSD